MLDREVAVGGGSIDLLLVDQDGVPTLVETKLIENADSRRAVVGQVLEYAASAVASWSAEVLRERAAAYWGRRKEPLAEALGTILEDGQDMDGFWQVVDEKLAQRRLRVIIVGDALHPEVVRIIEYLNQELQNLQIYGLEIKCYGESETHLVVVPRLVGQTQATADRKTRTIARQIIWTEDMLRAAFSSLQAEALHERLVMLLDWALSRGCFSKSVAAGPSFQIQKDGERLFTVSEPEAGGRVYFKMRDKNGQPRGVLLAEVQRRCWLPQEMEVESVTDGRYLNLRLCDLSNEGFAELMAFLNRSI